MSQSQFMDGPTAQRRVLDAAYAELAPARRAAGRVVDERLDSLHQAYVEILGRLPEHPDWCCEEGVASVEAARAQLTVRAGQRRIDQWRRSRRLVHVEDFDALGLVASEARRDGGLVELHTYLRSQLPMSEHAKLDRFVQHAILDLPHATIAQANGMTHAALRAESRRFARRIAPLLDRYIAQRV